MTVEQRQTSWSQQKIAGEMLKMLGIDPQQCSHAEIILDANDAIRVNATFQVFPEIYDENRHVTEIEALMKEFVMVEIEEKDDSTEATDES